MQCSRLGVLLAALLLAPDDAAAFGCRLRRSGGSRSFSSATNSVTEGRRSFQSSAAPEISFASLGIPHSADAVFGPENLKPETAALCGKRVRLLGLGSTLELRKKVRTILLRSSTWLDDETTRIARNQVLVELRPGSEIEFSWSAFVVEGTLEIREVEPGRASIFVLTNATAVLFNPGQQEGRALRNERQK